MYFYMATRYENNVGNWGNGVFSSSYPHLSEWTLAMFLRWHEQDPVSQKEKDRNNAIYSSTQHNRNPYIDYPELVDLIFGDQRTTPFDPDHQITDPDDDFKALDASSVSANGFIANWTQKNEADDYYLHVYQKQTTSDSDEVVELWSCNFADGIPEDWTPSTSGTYQEVDGLRLGTGSNDGSITSPTINTEQEIKLTIKACRYKTDAAKLMVYIDNQLLKTYDLSKSDLDEELVITSHSSNSKIKFLANKSKRVILQSVTCETNSQETIQSVEGYPLHTGNNLSYEVKSLLPETDYYYTVTPYKGNNSYTESNEVKVTTSVYSSLCKEPEEDQIITFYANGYITVLNAAPGSKIMVYNTNGALVMNKTVRNEEESLIMPEGGIYILKVLTESNFYTQKITAY